MLLALVAINACHPAGLDILTVLGAHEGEGLVLASNDQGLAGSNSPFLASRGQQVRERLGTAHAGTSVSQRASLHRDPAELG